MSAIGFILSIAVTLALVWARQHVRSRTRHRWDEAVPREAHSPVGTGDDIQQIGT